MYRIEEYIPDSLYDQWETVRDLAIDWLIRLGLVGRAAKGKSDGHDAPRQLHRMFHCARAERQTWLPLVRNIQT